MIDAEWDVCCRGRFLQVLARPGVPTLQGDRTKAALAGPLVGGASDGEVRPGPHHGGELRLRRHGDVARNLDHPNTTSMHEELSREFLASPPEEQLAEVERMRDSFSGMLAELEIILANTEPPADDLRWQLAAQLRSAIDAAADRISELRMRIDGGE